MSQSKKTILLLSADGNLQHALRRAKGTVLVIALDEPALQIAKAVGVAHRSAGDYLENPGTEPESASFELALRWYQVNGVDYTYFDGCSLGELVYIEVGVFNLLELTRKIVIVEALYAEESPAGWVLATGQNSIWKNIIQSRVAKSMIVSCVEPSPKKWWQRYANFREVKLWLRRQGLDYLARAWVFRLARWSKPQSAVIPSEFPYLFVVNIPGTSSLETLIPVIRETLPEERLVIATDPRCTKALEDAGIAYRPFEAEALGLAIAHGERIVQAQVRTNLRANWDALDAAMTGQPTPHMQFRGVDLWPFCRSDFHNLFLRRLPQAYEHYQLARAVFKAYQGQIVFTASDSHYMGMLFVRAAEREGRRSLTIQHGMVNHPDASSLPVRATQMAVMGEAIKEWLVDYGAKPEQMVVTGQPRFDALIRPPSVDRAALLTELDLQPEAQTWLIAPERLWGVWMRQVLFDALDAMPDVQAVVRVHPFDNPADYQKALKTHPNLSARVRLARAYDVPSALNACDVLVFGRSTLGLEALLLDKPLIVVRPPGKVGLNLPPYLHDYLDAVNCLCAQNSEELVQAWHALQRVETAAQVQQVKEWIVQRYACGRDGHSARRVLGAARRLAQEVQL